MVTFVGMPSEPASLTVTLRVLGGSWVDISGLTSPLTWVITIVTALITPFIPTHEPPSNLEEKVPPRDPELQSPRQPWLGFAS